MLAGGSNIVRGADSKRPCPVGQSENASAAWNVTVEVALLEGARLSRNPHGIYDATSLTAMGVETFSYSTASSRQYFSDICIAPNSARSFKVRRGGAGAVVVSFVPPETAEPASQQECVLCGRAEKVKCRQFCAAPGIRLFTSQFVLTAFLSLYLFYLVIHFGMRHARRWGIARD